MNNQSQIDQNEPRSASKVILEASRFEVAQKGAKSVHKSKFVGATWAIWGAIWDPLGAKGVPKSSILTSRRAKVSKNEVLKEASEK